jgi:hypothetical protein
MDDVDCEAVEHEYPHSGEVPGRIAPNAVEPDRIAECRSAVRRDDAEAHALKNFEREKSAVLPSAQPQSLCCQEHVLADCRRFAEDVVAGLPLDDR